jgi:hypothetical protein
MNDNRRKKIDEVLVMVRSAERITQKLYDDEYDAWDNLPDNLRYSSNGEVMEFSVEMLDQAVAHLDSLIDYLEDAKVDNWGGKSAFTGRSSDE